MSRTQRWELWSNGKLVDSGTIVIPTTPEQDNSDTLTSAATAALATNRAYLAAATSPLTTDQKQIVALTRQNIALIRLLLGLLDATN